MNKSLRDRLIDSLQKANVVKKDQLAKAIDIQQQKGGSLGKILIDLGYISHKDLLIFLSQQLSIPP